MLICVSLNLEELGSKFNMTPVWCNGHYWTTAWCSGTFGFTQHQHICSNDIVVWCNCNSQTYNKFVVVFAKCMMTVCLCIPKVSLMR